MKTVFYYNRNIGETQSGVDKHLETKVLDTGSMKDLSSMKTEQGRAPLLRGNMTLSYSISGVTNPPRES